MSDNVFKPDEGDFIIHYKVQNPGKYSLRIYNSAGELVRELKNMQSRWPAEDDVPWDGKNMKGDLVAAGVYVVYFESYRYIKTAKLLIIH